MRRIVRLFTVIALLLATSAAPRGQAVAVGPDDSTVYFAVIGDFGTASRQQLETAQMLVKTRERFPYTFVLRVGDNLYGGESPQDFLRKFQLPYKALLEKNIPFYASLGNHDDPLQRNYRYFNMGGERYYSFSKGPVQFFALDSTYMSPEQIAWFDRELGKSDAPWKISYHHHPMYSSGKRHGAELDLRRVVEPLLIKHHVQVVFTGHEHFYERYSVQNGVQHFITGAAGQLRPNNIARTKDTASGFDSDNSFMVAKVSGDELYFESISRAGAIVDAGIVSRQGGTRAVSPTSPKQ